MANVTPFDVIASAADIYVGAPNLAPPTLLQTMDPGMIFNGTPASQGSAGGQVTTGGLTGWFYLGYTDGGITVTPGQTVKDLFVDQTVFPVKTTRQAQSLKVAFSIVELTMDSFALALGNSVTAGAVQGITTGTNAQGKSIALGQSGAVNTVALCLRFPSPYGDYIAQWELPYVYQSGNPSVKFVKGDKAMMSVEFTVLGVSAANFGTLRARHIA